jgi:hypothetical protein
LIEAAIGGDSVQPGAQRVPVLVALKCAPGRQQCLLERVLGVLHRAEDPVAVQLQLQLATVGVGELAKRLLVPRAGAGERAVGHDGTLAQRVPFNRIVTKNPAGV